MDRGGWWATVHRITQSRTQLKLLSMQAHRVLYSPDNIKGYPDWVSECNLNHFLLPFLKPPAFQQLVWFFVCLVGCFWPHWASREFLVPQPRMEPTLPKVEARSLNHWSARKVPQCNNYLHLAFLAWAVMTTWCSFKSLPSPRVNVPCPCSSSISLSTNLLFWKLTPCLKCSYHLPRILSP